MSPLETALLSVGVTVEQAAARLLLDPRMLRNVCNGYQPFPERYLSALAEILLVDVATAAVLVGRIASKDIPNQEALLNPQNLPFDGSRTYSSGGILMPLGYATTVRSTNFFQPPPEVLMVVPPLSPSSGGTDIMITGSNFLRATEATVNGTPIDNFLVVDDTTITGQVSADSDGVYDVVVTSPNGSGTLVDGFCFADIALWLQSDSGITLNSGNVSAWADKSGNGRNMIQNSATNQPGYTASDSDFGGYPSINPSPNVGVFAHKGLRSSSSFAIGAYSAFFVCCGKNPSGGSAGNGYFFLHQTDANNYSYSWTANGYSHAADRSANLTGRDAGGTWADWGTTTAKTCRFEFAGTNASNIIYLNGVAQSMSTVVGLDPGTGTISATLQLFWDGSSNSGGMKTAEVLILNGVNAAVNTFIENYQRGRYGHY